MFTKILVPVDLVEPDMTKKGVDVAVALANISNAGLRLVYVQFPMPPSSADFVPTDLGEQLRLASEQQLTDVADGIDYSKERITTVLRFGSVYHEVLTEAQEWGADLVVICSHRPSMSTYLLGSNAQSIVRHAKTSVLVVR